MPIFIYKAKKNNAENVSGEVTARDTDEAVELISQQGLLPVSVVEKGDSLLFTEKKNRHVSRRDISVFTRQLVSLLKSGIPLLQALDVLSRQTRSVSLGWILTQMTADIRNGRSFSACLADRSDIFPSLYASMAKAGEESGKLPVLLGRMAVYYKQQEDIAMKVRSALAYPLFMLLVGGATVVFVLTFVMPKIAVLFEGLGSALPLPTQIILAVSQYVRQGWPLLLLFILMLVLGWRMALKSSQFRRSIHQFILSIPMVSDLMIKLELERFSRTLSLLLESGISILRAFEIAIPTLSNESLQKDLWLCQSKVAGGMSFGEALGEVVWMPDIVGQLVAVGETSGQLPQSLNDIADTYEQDIAEVLKTVTTLLEPVLILLVGGIVGFIVFAMLLPVFQMDLFAR
jgi:type IV pilus assembly protein PilC